MKSKYDGGALEQSSGSGKGSEWHEEWLSNEASASASELPAMGRQAGRHWLRQAGCLARQCLHPGGEVGKQCLNTSCRLQPFCRCARAAWAVSNSKESRLWILLLILAAVLIGLALVRTSGQL